MRTILKYIKPYWLSLILAVALLYFQVNFDLALPDYMSKIVNVGIQQGGVEDIYPSIIRKDKYKQLSLFISEDHKNVLDNSYTLGSYKDIDNVYNLNPGALFEESFDTDFSKALLVVYELEKMIAKEGSVPGFPSDIDIFTYLENLKSLERKAVTDSIFSKLLEIDGNFLKQGAISAVKEEYTSLGMNISSIQTSYILKVGGVMLLFTFMSVICAVSVGFIGSVTAAGTARGLRKDLFIKVENFSHAEFDKFSTASLITRSTNDITQIQNIVFMVIRMVVYAPLLGVGGFIRAMSKAPSMGWIIGLAVVVLLIIIIIVMSVALPKFTIVQKLVDRLNLVTRENLGGLLVVRAFNREKFEENRFDKANRDLTETNLFVQRTMVVMMPVIMLIMNVLTVAVVWLGSHQVALGAMQVGDMMAFIQYAMQIVMAFMMLSMVFIFLPRAIVSARRIIEVLNTTLSITDPINPVELPKTSSGVIEFNNVSFRYPGGEENALTNISFKSVPGTTTAFIGATGSGKSTVVNLIPRFYDVTEGSITLDGVDIRDLSQNELRSVLGYVPQKNLLFSGTIETNLLYGKKDGDSNDLNRAIEVSQAKEFIDDKKEGMQFGISQDGTNVSGGQRQRLAIARALIKESPVNIFDDSFSALDFKTDSSLRKALKERAGNSTTLLVAQRVATIMGAEQIIVLDDGKIIGKGSHKELMENCEEYKEIAHSQLGSKEVTK